MDFLVLCLCPPFSLLMFPARSLHVTRGTDGTTCFVNLGVGWRQAFTWVPGNFQRAIILFSPQHSCTLYMCPSYVRVLPAFWFIFYSSPDIDHKHMSHSPHPQLGKRAQQRVGPQQVFAEKGKNEHRLSLFEHIWQYWTPLTAEIPLGRLVPWPSWCLEYLLLKFPGCCGLVISF